MQIDRRHLLSLSRRLVVSGGALSWALTASPAVADTNDDVSVGNVIALPEVVVVGRSDSLIDVAGTASEGVVGQDQILRRQLFRSG